MATDRIEKKIVLRAPRSRVWRALANAKEFGTWFGAKLDGAVFAPASLVKAQLTVPGYETWQLEMTIERIEPEHLFSYRWHPYPEPGWITRASPPLSSSSGSTTSRAARSSPSWSPASTGSPHRVGPSPSG